MPWRMTAYIVVAVHAAYVAIVVIGFAAILIGSAARWRWVRNFYFRAEHLAMILLVCAEALVGTSCPLTRLENALRLRGGETGYARDFIGYWLDWLIFYNAPSWVFTAVYLTFGVLVLSTLWFAPVRWPAFLIQMRNTDTVAKLQADPTSRELPSGLYEDYRRDGVQRGLLRRSASAEAEPGRQAERRVASGRF